jgi:hypothetical protein
MLATSDVHRLPRGCTGTASHHPLRMDSVAERCVPSKGLKMFRDAMQRVRGVGRLRTWSSVVSCVWSAILTSSRIPSANLTQAPTPWWPANSRRIYQPHQRQPRPACGDGSLDDPGAQLADTFCQPPRLGAQPDRHVGIREHVAAAGRQPAIQRYDDYQSARPREQARPTRLLAGDARGGSTSCCGANLTFAT